MIHFYIQLMVIGRGVCGNASESVCFLQWEYRDIEYIVYKKFNIFRLVYLIYSSKAW